MQIKSKPRPAARLASLLLLAFFTLGALSGCGLSRPAPERKTFLIQTSAAERVATVKPGTSLAVRSVRVAQGFDERTLVYRTGESTYAADYYNVFFIDPPAMLAAEARKRLERTGPFETVLDPGSRLEPTHRLELFVPTMHGDYRDSGNPRAVLEVQALLTAGTVSQPKVLLKRDYRRETPATDRTPEALVTAHARALAEILDALAADMTAAMR